MTEYCSNLIDFLIDYFLGVLLLFFLLCVTVRFFIQL
jgi:hypothetical protein